MSLEKEARCGVHTFVGWIVLSLLLVLALIVGVTAVIIIHISLSLKEEDERAGSISTLSTSVENYLAAVATPTWGAECPRDVWSKD